MIPLVLLAGFLGAGKTRLLTDLVPVLASLGVRARIVLNDFENAEVDAARLGALTALVTPLNGECVCCGSLRELLDTLYAVPADPGSVLFIEANGATETDELIGHLSADERLRHFTLPLQVTVLDASRWQRRWWHNALERAQTTTATQLWLNWTERLSPARLDAVRASVHTVNPRATFIDVHGFACTLRDLSERVQYDASLGGRTAVAPGTPAHAHASAHASALPPAHRHGHTHPFGSASMPLPRTVNREKFSRFVRALPKHVVRAKGLVRFDDEPAMMYVWHRVPGRTTVRLDPSWPHADAAPTALFIGVDMPLESIADAVAGLAT